MPVLYRVCGTSRPLISDTPAGTRNHKICEEKSVSDGVRRRQPVCRAGRRKPYTQSTTKATSNTICSVRLTIGGIFRDRNSGSLDGPEWKLRNSTRYET